MVFLVAVLSKVRDGRQLREFADSVAALRLLPAGMAGPVAVLVAGAELMVCALLVALPARAATACGLGLAAAMLGGFAAAIATGLRRGVTASCRCFGGSLSAPFGWHHVIRNVTLGLISLSGAYAVYSNPPRTSPPWPSRLRSRCWWQR